MDDARGAFRLAQARRETPRGLGWVAATILVLSLVNPLTSGDGITYTEALHLGVVLVFATGAYLAGRPWLPAWLPPWIVGACALALVLSFQLEVWLHPTALGVAYILMSMLAFPPFTLSMRVSAVVAVPMTAGFVITMTRWAPDDIVRWVAAAAAALVTGGVILRLRLAGIDELGESTARQRDLATHDALTGVLNRRGVEERAVALMALARRQEQPVSVTFVDIDGLKAANDTHGHDFGDTVIVAVAGALRALVRESDLVGRWGGDEFIVVGMGEPPAPAHLEERLAARFAADGVDLARWPGRVSTGSAVTSAGGSDFVDLVVAADADMYQRRLERRT